MADEHNQILQAVLDADFHKFNTLINKNKINLERVYEVRSRNMRDTVVQSTLLGHAVSGLINEDWYDEDKHEPKQKNTIRIVKRLIELGADVDVYIRYVSNYGDERNPILSKYKTTVIGESMAMKQWDVVDELLRRGADPDKLISIPKDTDVTKEEEFKPSQIYAYHDDLNEQLLKRGIYDIPTLKDILAKHFSWNNREMKRIVNEYEEGIRGLKRAQKSPESSPESTKSTDSKSSNQSKQSQDSKKSNHSKKSSHSKKSGGKRSRFTRQKLQKRRRKSIK